MKRTFIILLTFLGIQTVFAEDKLVKILREEVNRNMQTLGKQTIPAYYLSYRVQEYESHQINASFGQVINSTPSKNRKYHTTVRVGSPEFDNTKQILSTNFDLNAAFQGNYFLVYENDAYAIKNALWRRTDQVYKHALRQYENIKTNTTVSVAPTDRSNDFTIETPEKYIEAPLSFPQLVGDVSQWEEKLRKYSGAFADYKEILHSNVNLNIELTRKYFVDSDGVEVTQNTILYRLGIEASTIADDGMELFLFDNWHTFDIKGFPTDEEITESVHQICKMLIQLKNAPVADTYTGPALMTGKATGVFFHEIFGHRIEGARLKQESDGQTFKKKIGEQILPKDISIFFDPQKKEYNGTPLIGHYIFDDEGIRGEKVNIVENGILKSFLMNRTPIEGFSQSNGHGRGEIIFNTVTRQSNMFIESKNPKSEKQLREMLISEAKRNNLEYAYLFDIVQGGFTLIQRNTLNSFNVNPLVVYRVYVDGRPDELVRGVEMIGTPLSMFSQITACGKDASIFNGACRAESGWVPVSAVSPSLFIKNIETQKKAKSQAQQPLLERP